MDKPVLFPRMKPETKEMMLRLISLRLKGFSLSMAGKEVGLSRSAVSAHFHRARALGLLPPADPKSNNSLTGRGYKHASYPRKMPSLAPVPGSKTKA